MLRIATQSGKKTFLAYTFGAPMAYSGKRMTNAHAHMNLTEAHFNAVAGHLVNTLTALQVHQNLFDDVVVITMSKRNDILGI